MKEVRSKRGIKQIIYIIVVLMLCNFIIPNYVYAADTKDGGDFFDPLIKFCTYLCDSVMQFMQNTFTSNHSIDNGDGTYDFQYSPAIIFSGTVQGLDINFITPNTDVRNTNNFESFVISKEYEYFKLARDSGTTLKFWTDAAYEEEKQGLEGYKCTFNEYHPLVSIGQAALDYHNYYIYYLEENNMLYAKYIFKVPHDTDEYLLTYTPEPWPITEEFLNEMNATVTYTSIASELQPMIATWYNALRRIALVGLLSALVYLGIRIILSSASEKGNSKYKKMLTDWLIALCLLFTLHYIMSATLVIVKEISAVFSTGTTDELLNTLRYEINEESNGWGNVLAQVIMYISLVIVTISFTFKYLKRVLYMAFFTLIAPLVTLTYPIDKAGDGKAQAFTIWIREYLFNALIQVAHLVVYYVVVGNAVELVKSFPLYGVVAVAFMTQGEKIIRSMFGFNNADSIGTVGAAATGGLVVSAMNKLKTLPSGAKGGKSGSSGGSTKGNVRTATNNPKMPTQGGKNASKGTGGTGGAGGSTTGTQTSTPANSAPNRNIAGGAKSLAGKYYKQVGGAALGVLTGGAGAMIGFAAGVAQGDMGAAFTGALAGGVAGRNLGQAAANLPENITNGVRSGWNNIKDTYREGAYGTEAAQAIKFDEEFRKGSTYKALQSNPNFSEDSVQEMLNAGITDKKAMTSILDSGMDVNDAIKYYTIAQNCPPEIYYDKKMLKTFCKGLRNKDDMFEGQSYGKIRDAIAKFM